MEKTPEQCPPAEVALRCMNCGAEMILVKAIEDWTMPVLGFERHAYMCSDCGNTEQRTVFDKRAKERHSAQIAAILTPPPTAPTVSVENQQIAKSFLRRVLAKMLGR